MHEGVSKRIMARSLEKNIEIQTNWVNNWRAAEKPRDTGPGFAGFSKQKMRLPA